MQLFISNGLVIACLLLSIPCLAQNNCIRIQGELDNLPDGKMIFQTRDRKTGKPTALDTVETRQGVFAAVFSKVDYPEPIRIELIHYQHGTQLKRLFAYATKLRYNGGALQQTQFMLEDGVQLNGTLKEEPPRPQPSGEIIIPTSVDRPIVTGRQTQVFYTDTVNFAGITNVAQAKKLIRQHPYSFYYLYALEQRTPQLTDAVFRELFASFDADVQNSRTGKELLAYVNERGSKQLTFATALPDEQGKAKPVLNKNARYNLVVLWASWCGPCRQEIPALKQLHSRYGDGRQLQLVSISVDEKRDAWQKAMAQEKMPWPQLLMTPKTNTFAPEIFQFDGSIPLMLLVNQQAKVVKQLVGYNEKNLATIEAIVALH